jgi:hypothetical protein
LLQTRPFEHDALGNVTKWWHYDDVTDDAIIEDVVDLKSVGEFNREVAKENTGRFGDGIHWIGSIPMPIYWRLKQRGVLDDDRALKRWWLSDEAAPFRGRDMRL